MMENYSQYLRQKAGRHQQKQKQIIQLPVQLLIHLVPLCVRKKHSVCFCRMPFLKF